MSESRNLVVFTLDDQQYGLNLSCVERIVRAVEVTRLPDVPSEILGVINVEGEIIPVVNSRRRLSLPEREIELSDHFIVVNQSGKSLALVADKVDPVLEIPEHRVVVSDQVVPLASCVQGVAKMEEGMIIILDAETMLLAEEHESIHVAVEAIRSGEYD